MKRYEKKFKEGTDKESVKLRLKNATGVNF